MVLVAQLNRLCIFEDEATEPVEINVTETMEIDADKYTEPVKIDADKITKLVDTIRQDASIQLLQLLQSPITLSTAYNKRSCGVRLLTLIKTT